MNMKRLWHLCTVMLALIVKYLKRRLVLTVSCALVIVILIKWKLTCTNLQRLHIQDVCSSYVIGQSVGNMCKDICQPKEISSFSCYNFYKQQKEAVFSGTWRNTSVVFKSVKTSNGSTSQRWSDTSNNKKIYYPSKDNFLKMIKTTIKVKFNISVNAADVRKIFYAHHNHRWSSRHIEMEYIWSLLQDNEYLALSLYERFEIFPKLLGTCGSLYAVEKFNTISGFWHLMTLYDSQEEWKKRIKISIMILDFLLYLETKLPEPLLICNVKMNHFGVTNDFKKIMYLDLDSVHPLSVASGITGDGSACKRHSDCDFLNCRSFCNLITYKCQHGVVNNNLQIVCERIFLGWVMSGRMMVPGLLLGPRTPRVLIEVLELCANPASESGTPRAAATREIRKTLHDLLVHMTWSY